MGEAHWMYDKRPDQATYLPITSANNNNNNTFYLYSAFPELKDAIYSKQATIKAIDKDSKQTSSI